MDGLLKLLGIVKRDNVSFGVEQVSFSVAFENLAKHPAVTMSVAKLHVLQLCIESGGAGLGEKSEFRPQAAQAGSFRIPFELRLFFIKLGRVLLLRIHLVAIA